MNTALQSTVSRPTSTVTCMTVPSVLINNNSSQVFTAAASDSIAHNSYTHLNHLLGGPEDFDGNSFGVPWLLNAIRGKPLVVSLVGLPGRGKTIIATKLKRFLLWNKICCEVFHLSNYRRLIAPEFNEHVINEPLKTGEEELRKQCFHMLFEDVDSFFSEGTHAFSVNAAVNGTDGVNKGEVEDVPFLQNVRGNVAIFDFANTQRSHRRELFDFCSSRDYDLFFIETITYDLNLIQLYIKGIELTNPDYLNMSREDAVLKFENHFRDYADSYQTLDDQVEEDIAFLKIFDGGSRCLVHNMHGYMQSKMVYYLMTLHFARQPIYITRHGEAYNNTLGIIGGDSELTARGFKYADAFASYINNLPELKNFSSSIMDHGGQPGVQVWASTLKRTQQTASRVHAPVLCWNALTELDAGQFDGKSYEYIEKNHPQDALHRREDKFRYRYPDGESYDDLVTRLEPVIMELERTRSTIVIVCHQGVMRCLMAYLLDRDFDELPYLDVPLHHLYKITPHACGYEVEDIDFNIPSNEYIRSKERKKSSVVQPPKVEPNYSY